MSVFGWLGWILFALMVGLFFGAGIGAWVQIQREKDERCGGAERMPEGREKQNER